MSRIVLPLCLLALACSNSGKLSSVETVDDTDTTDGSDGADVTDGSDGTDEADASDGADGSDGDDTADSGDTGSGEDPVVVLPALEALKLETKVRVSSGKCVCVWAGVCGRRVCGNVGACCV